MLAYIWFALIGVLVTGYVVMDGLDLGTGIIYPFIAKSEEDRRVVLRSVGPVWDGNEVWLLTAGGALFAAFPAVYATVFSGFYLALMLVLFCLILRVGALEFRPVDPEWRGFWDGVLFVASALISLLIGVAAGNLIRGIPLTNAGEFAGNFFTLLNPFALLVGVTGFVWFMLQGSSWLALKATGELQKRAAVMRRFSTLAVIIMFIVTTVLAPMLAPTAFATGTSTLIAFIAAAVAIVGIVMSIVYGSRNRDLPAFVGSSLVIAGAVGIWAGSVFPNIVPALGGSGPSLSIAGSSSSNLALLAMLIIAAIGVPLVLGYSVLIYRTYAGRIAASDETDGHY